jgi:hypothetical protein
MPTERGGDRHDSNADLLSAVLEIDCAGTSNDHLSSAMLPAPIETDRKRSSTEDAW